MELTKETSLFKKDAIKTDVVAAAATATNYIEDVSGSNQTGMTLQPASNSADNYMQLDATEIGIYQNGHKIASYGNIITLYRLVNDNPVKTLEITGTGLQLYGSSTINADVSLTSAGLVLGKGGIEAGTPGSNNFIYLSTEGYPLKNSNVTPTITGLTINNFTPTAAQTDGRTTDDMPWRQVIGTKFGVTSDGTLYANGAHITGQITIDGHSDSLSTEMTSLQTATDDAATKATNFLTNLSGIDGLIVRKDASSNNDYVNILSNAIRIVTGGAEAFKAWVENSITKLRLGALSSIHMILGNNLIQFMLNQSTEIGRIMLRGTESTSPVIADNSMWVGRMFSSSGGNVRGSASSYSDNETSTSFRKDGYSASMSHLLSGTTVSSALKASSASSYMANDTNYTPEAGVFISVPAGAEKQSITIQTNSKITFQAAEYFFNMKTGYNFSNYQKTWLYLPYIPRETSGLQVRLAGSGSLMYLVADSSSSKRYKHSIMPISSNELDPHKLYNIEVVQFVYNDDHVDNTDQRFRKNIPGFIAEDVYKHYPIAVDLKDERPENWNHRYILPPMLKLIQEQHQEIEELKTKISILEEKIL